MSDPTPEKKLISLNEFKATDENSGGFEGYANNFGVLDSYDDITVRGCFADYLADLVESGFGAADHRWGIASELGIFKDAFEDEVGLYVDISYHPTDDCQQIRQKVNNRLANQKKVPMSIGFYTKKKTYVYGEEAIPFLINPSQDVLAYLKERKPIVRILQKCMIFEASIVARGANGASGVSEGKSSLTLPDKELIQKERKELITGEDGASIAKKLQVLNLKLRMLPA